MNSFLLALTAVITFTCTVESAPHPNLVDTDNDHFLKHQEQAPVAPTGLKCYICSENCSTTQTPGSGCRPGRSCYSVHAFDTALNKSVTRKGCIPEFFCTQNRACVFLNQSRSGALRSCSISCCSTPLCNGPPLPTTQPITTTAPPTTTTAPPTTLPTTVPTTVPTTAPTTAPILPGVCGGPLAPPSGYFSSPFYPRSYPNNANCVWTIMVPRGSVLKIDFLAFDTEECFDSLHIYVGRRLVHRLSGDDADDDDDDDRFEKCEKDDKDDGDDGEGIFGWYFNRDEELEDESVTIQGTGEMIRLVFMSDYSITKRGFYAKYSVMKAICGGPLALPSGTFRSPGYPGKYPDDVKCIWTIRVPPGSTLELDFRFFKTEKCDDYLKILQGGRKIRKLSGVYRYSLFGWGNNDDDDCDDDDKDGEDGEEGEDDEYVGEDRSKRFIFPVQRFPSPVGNRLGFPTRGRIGAPYVTRVLIPGTGELISIVFKSDDDDVTEKGFEAMYRVRPGAAFHG